MRIVAGRHRGARLVAPTGRATRPTSDRAREAVFSMLGSLEGAHVLDLYAGSGAMGIEALSRGAATCVFVDASSKACTSIRSNLEKVHELETARIVCRDVPGVLRDECRRSRSYDLVLADPPYSDWAGLEGQLAELLPPVVAAGGRVVVETAERVAPELPLALVTTRRYGSARMTVFAR